MNQYFCRFLAGLLVAGIGLMSLPALGSEPDFSNPCDAAAAKAERDWNIPPGLLAAIGTVESGRTDFGISGRQPWPWSINAEGQGFYASSKAEAVEMVRQFQARGMRYIDIGCFQVDLGYHPYAFSSLEEGFDPSINAQAAARILTEARLRSAGWGTAVALYHSASPVQGGTYLRQVQSALPAAQSRLLQILLDEGGPSPYAPLLSPQAALVRVVYLSRQPRETAKPLPQVIELSHKPMPSIAPHPQIVWLTQPKRLPQVLKAGEKLARVKP